MSAGLDGTTLINDILILHDFAGEFGEMALDLVVRRNFAAAGIRGASVRGAGVLVGVGAGVAMLVVMMTRGAGGVRGTVTSVAVAGVARPGVAEGLRAQRSTSCGGEGVLTLSKGASMGCAASGVVRIGAGLTGPSSEVATLHAAGSSAAVVSSLLTDARSIVITLRSAESSVASIGTLLALLTQLTLLTFLAELALLIALAETLLTLLTDASSMSTARSEARVIVVRPLLTDASSVIVVVMSSCGSANASSNTCANCT